MSICELSEISLTHAQLCLSSGMSASQDNLLNQEVNEAQGEALLDQSVHSGEDSSEDVIVEYERILGPRSPKIGCENADLFEDDGVTDSQLLRCTEAPTQEEEPEGPVQSPEVEVIPPSETMEGIESQQSAPLRDGQDIIGHGDLDNLSPSGEETPRRWSLVPTSLSLVSRISRSLFRS